MPRIPMMHIFDVDIIVCFYSRNQELTLVNQCLLWSQRDKMKRKKVNQAEESEQDLSEEDI